MRSTILTVLAAASVASAQSSTITPAPVVTGNPSGASYIATLPAKAGSPLAGSIMAVSGAGGTGVKYTVKFSGLPDAGGPFLYHIHEKAVPENGNCTATGAHLDPYKRGEVPPCDATKPETCQTGDLSGKYGLITAKEWSVEYTDPFTATRKDDPSFFGNLSFVVHLNNKTRIGCANFKPMDMGAPYTAPNATASVKPTGGMPMSPTSAVPSKPAQFTGAAVKVLGGTGAMLAAAAAFML